MSYTPSAAPRLPQKKNNDNKGIIVFLSIALAIAIGYIIYDKVQDNNVAATNQTTVTSLTTAKDSVQHEFAILSKKMDTLSLDNTKLTGDLANKNAEVQQQKQQITQLLQKKNLTTQELKKAKAMIADLNEKVNSFAEEIAKLKEENKKLDSANQQLTTDKSTLTKENSKLQDNLSSTENEKKELAEKVSIASTLQISGIDVTAIEVKSNGKEKETTKAKNVNQFRISCVLNENRVTESGKKLLYVCVYNPDGSPSGVEGNFKLRDGSEKSYTNKVEVNYQQGKTSNVSFNWQPDKKFTPGTYKIEMYNNGFKIGEANKELRKGGLF